jgi:hypothetical protein
VQEKLKGRREMDATTNYEAPDVFYRAEGGEAIMWRRNG